ncbi:energy-coupling factor ABC transporter ATP-binding protein [Pseudobacillus wudalianchiensis]|uniref:ABC transporter ATP-binding protein n=1 Tax=Pseudobacillus wudalianchiensis TaxID=1743143 RepID=A0A1B9AMN5_9BACI|nr:energy-coupling factor ABC transporter ATP-binding protein [Bacillus wudalianchiensis]OCA85184.1 energy-coupling factor ABC transporter ATP-binding protein [Bacillus wudalianchiensis]
MIELKEVSYHYTDGTKALHEVSLTITAGRKIAVLGNNGAGKSTLFLHLNGLLRPTEGQLLFNGSPFTYKRKQLQELRRQVGLVFQNPDTQLFSPTVREDVLYGPSNLEWEQERIEQAAKQAMEQTGVLEFQHKPPHFLSIGQKKRAAIASVLAMQPKLLVLDEPTAGLDPYYARKILHLLTDWHHEETTIMLSTHDVDFAYEWADEILVMKQGSIQAFGRTVDIFNKPELLADCHLERPWIMEVYAALQIDETQKMETIPRSKPELLEWIMKKTTKDRGNFTERILLK